MNPSEKETSSAFHTVVFQPAGRRGLIEEGKTLLEAAQQLGVGIQNLCGGAQTCGRCRVTVEQGYFDKENLRSDPSHLTSRSEREHIYLEKNQFQAADRFACEAKVQGDLVISVPAESRLNRQIIRKEAGSKVITLNPAVKLHYVELDQPTMEEESWGDLQLLYQALNDQFQLENLTMDYQVLRELQQTLREGDWAVTVTVWDDREIIQVQPGFHDRAIGLAVDIGTTTLAAYLCDLETGELLETRAKMNPQVSYGEDVMSRISYVKENGEEGLQTLQEALLEALNELCLTTTGDVGLSPADVAEVTLVGNTVMHHLVLGFDPQHLGGTPFRANTSDALNIKARDLGLRINPAANVYLLPIKAGYVGADNMGVVLAEEPHLQEEITLILDVGTNGEILLGSKHRLLSTSSPTGPAFEGAQITHGMRAAEGAVERVRIDPLDKGVRLQVIGREEWIDTEIKQGRDNAHGEDHQDDEGVKIRGICGSGIIDAAAEMYRAGIITASGAFNSELEHDRLITFNGLPAFMLADETQTHTGQKLVVTLSDVRNVQLAKAALYTGVKVLMAELGAEKIERVILAGAFGSYIDSARAMILGLFPDCDPEFVVPVGNAAGDGARIALLNKNKRQEIAEIARWIEHVAIPLNDEFQDLYMASLAIPHAEDHFPHVEQWIQDSTSLPDKYFSE